MKRLRVWRLQQLACVSYALVLTLVTMAQTASHALQQDRRSASDDRATLARGLDEVFSLIRANFVEDVDPRILAEAAVNGMIEVADPTGALLAKDPFKRLARQSNGVRNDQDRAKVVADTYAELAKRDGTTEALRLITFGGMQRMIKAVDPDGAILSPNVDRFRSGIGVTVGLCGGLARVTSVVENGPAHRAGMRVADSVNTIDGRGVLGLTAADVTGLLRGPNGTAVRVGVRGQGSGEVTDLEVVRELVDIASVRNASMIDERIGYVRLDNFEERTDQDFGDALGALAAKGMRELILDLRENAGGPLGQPIKLAMRFLPRGHLIVYMRGRRPMSNQDYRATETNTFTELGLAVLVNGATAAGAEILAGALQDHDRAVIVGTRTFGNASVQSVYRLADGSAMHLTTSRWFRPKGSSVKPGGVTPDILADGPPCEVVRGSQDDLPLRRAMETLKKRR